MQKNPIVILGSARTPIGNLLGELKDFSAPQLGSFALKAAINHSQLSVHEIDEVIMGCVLPAGQGQAPARQAALLAGLPHKTTCTTINKICGSGMKAVMFAHDLLQVGSATCIAAGGMESMTQAPYLLAKARQGYRLGNNEIYDHLMLDGLMDAYEGKPMGFFAEQCAQKYQFTREQQDEFSYRSFHLAQEATNRKWFANEMVPIALQTKQGIHMIDKDERIGSVDLTNIRKLSPAFSKTGTVTAGNSSSIADGAAALVLMRLEEAEKRGLKPLAKIIGHASIAKSPNEFTTAPIDVLYALLKKINWSLETVDLFEINEAFAVVVLAFMHELKISRHQINIHGGACALGHPIGASGARILVTLVAAMQRIKAKRGIAVLCIGGGEATACAIELC